MYMDGIWLRPGQAKIVPADTNYGDATVTGEGCIFLEIFGDHYGAKPDYDEPEEMAYWNEVHGTDIARRTCFGHCAAWLASSRTLRRHALGPHICRTHTTNK